MQQLTNYIDGEQLSPQKQGYLENIEPSTGQVYNLIPDSTAEDVELAVQAAQRALPIWANLSGEERADYLACLADAIDQQADELARLESLDNGKPLRLAASVDIPRASANLRFFSRAITQYASESHSMADVAINYTLREPIGVVACISPWNLPLYLLTWKIAPALAAGNCVVAKPSEVTPFTAYWLGKLCQQVGLPPGVLNIIHGTGQQVGQAIVSHSQVKAISFTGGTQTGAQIASIAAPAFKKLSLELGGKNPALIFADCEFEATLDTVVRSSFSNQGQICLCSSRIYVQREIYTRFCQAFVKKVKELKVGDPTDPSSQQGAIVSQTHMEKILEHIALAQQEGGSILTGGQRKIIDGRCKDGYFIEPTIIAGLSIDARANQEEIFGPVVTISPFDDEQQALSLANASVYGLAATVHSSDVKRCHRLSRQLEFGIVWVNTWLLRDLRTPFGGVKQSGVGREGGLEALRFFTEAKNVCIKY